MSRMTELNYINMRVRAEDRMAANASCDAAARVHSELADLYREARRTLQGEIGALLQARDRLRMLPPDWFDKREFQTRQGGYNPARIMKHLQQPIVAN